MHVWSAGLAAVDKGHHAAVMVGELPQHSLVVTTGWVSRGLPVQNVDAVKELPLLRRQFDAFAVAGDNRDLRDVGISTQRLMAFSLAQAFGGDDESASDGKT